MIRSSTRAPLAHTSDRLRNWLVRFPDVHRGALRNAKCSRTVRGVYGRLYYSRIDLGMYPEIYSNAYFREIQLQRARGNASWTVAERHRHCLWVPENAWANRFVNMCKGERDTGCGVCKLACLRSTLRSSNPLFLSYDSLTEFSTGPSDQNPFLWQQYSPNVVCWSWSPGNVGLNAFRWF